MALVTSGLLSIGGSTSTRSINLELSLSSDAASNLNQSNFRSLAGVASGKISISDFYGKSAGGKCTAISLYYDGRGVDSVCQGEGRPATYYIDASYGSGNIYTDSDCQECTAGNYGDGNGKTYAVVAEGKEGCTTGWRACER